MALTRPVEEDIFAMSPEQRRKKGIMELPGSLVEAISVAEGSTLVRDTLGAHIFGKFLENKKIEWDRYRTRVTSYELEQYLPRL
jgi:glutamine synthetase